MSRQSQCGHTEARNRVKIARSYLDVAELAAHEPADGTRNVAAGNAVLAGIAASDVICCVRLGTRHRGQDHHGALALLRTVYPDGSKLAADLASVLAVKERRTMAKLSSATRSSRPQCEQQHVWSRPRKQRLWGHDELPGCFGRRHSGVFRVPGWVSGSACDSRMFPTRSYFEQSNSCSSASGAPSVSTTAAAACRRSATAASLMSPYP